MAERTMRDSWAKTSRTHGERGHTLHGVVEHVHGLWEKSQQKGRGIRQ